MAGLQWEGASISRTNGRGVNRIATVRANTVLMNGIALLIALGLYVLIFRGIWNVQVPKGGVNVLVIVVAAFGLIVIHEGIHGAAALLYVEPVKISFKAQWLVVMCKVDALMGRNQYIFYALAPTMVFGLVGIALYYSLGSVEQKFFSALLFLGGVSSGSGDLWFVFQVLKFGSNTCVIDHGVEIEVFANDTKL